MYKILLNNGVVLNVESDELGKEILDFIKTGNIISPVIKNKSFFIRDIAAVWHHNHSGIYIASEQPGGKRSEN